MVKNNENDKNVPQPLNLALTEADIVARKQELDQMREEAHKTQMDELDSKIMEMDKKKQDMEKEGRDRIASLCKEKEEVKEQLGEALKQQEEAIRDLKGTHAREIGEFRQEVEDLQGAVVEARKELVRKKGLVAELTAKKKEDEEQCVRDQDTLRNLIEEEKANLEHMKKDHEDMAKKKQEEHDAKLKAFNDEKEYLTKKIANLKKHITKCTKAFNDQKGDLVHKRDVAQGDLDKAREKREKQLGPLKKRKGELMDEIKAVQDKIKDARAKEDQKTEDLINKYEVEYDDKQREFDDEREAETRKVFEKECELKDKELELEKLRADQEQQLRDLENEIMEKLRGMEEEIEAQDEQNRKQLQQVLDKEKFREIEEQIHQKTCELQNLEANQQAEEALLKVWLEAVSDKAKHLRDELNAKQARYGNKISSLDNDLNAAKQKAEQGQRIYDSLKDDVEKQLQEKRDEFENHTRDAAARLNNLNNQIAELKRSLKNREDAAKDRGETIERRITDETRRLQKLKSDLEQQMGPMREKHNELKQRVAEEKEKHQAQLSKLHKEQQTQNKEQEDELNKLYVLLETVRSQFKEERQQLQSSLKDILDSNDRLREKHEKEIFDLNMRLVQTLQATSQEKIDTNTTKDLLGKVRDLQDQYAKKVRAYENALADHAKEKQEMKVKNEEEVRQIKTEIRRLSQDYEGGKNPAERVDKLRQILEKKTQELEKAKDTTFSGTNQAQLTGAIEEAKRKNAELSAELQCKKRELNTLMNRRHDEIEELTNKIEKQNVEMSKAELEFKTPSQQSNLKERLDKLAALRALIRAEIQERKQILEEIALLQKQRPKISSVSAQPRGQTTENIHIQKDVVLRGGQEKKGQGQEGQGSNQGAFTATAPGGTVAAAECVSPVDYILDMIAQKEVELAKLNSVQLSPEKLENLDTLKAELEALRNQLPMDNEKKTCLLKQECPSGGKVSTAKKKLKGNDESIAEVTDKEESVATDSAE